MPSSMSLANAPEKLQMNRVISTRTYEQGSPNLLLEEHVLVLRILESVLLECLIADQGVIGAGALRVNLESIAAR